MAAEPVFPAPEVPVPMAVAVFKAAVKEISISYYYSIVGTNFCAMLF